MSRQGSLPQRAIRESEFQRQVLDMAVMYRWHLWPRDVPQDDPHFSLPGIVWHPTLAKFSERGWPDLTMVRVRGGGPRRLLFAELKASAGRVSARQQQVLSLLRLLEGTWRAGPDSLQLLGEPRVPLLQIEVYVWRPDDLGQIAEVLA